MTALSLVYPIQNFITSVGVGFGIGINAAIAFFLGAQDQKKADTAATQGLFLSVIHGIVLTVVTIAVMPLFLQIFTKDVTVIQMGNAYSRIAFGFSIVISLEITWEKIFQAVGQMKITMVSLLVHDLHDERMYIQYRTGSTSDLRNRTVPENGN